MNVVISRADAAALLARAQEAAPQECCGLLLGEREELGLRVTAIVPAVNVSADPLRTFEIDPAVLVRIHREAREQGRTLIGWYHSHPTGSGTPSARDAAMATEAGRVWIIVAAQRLHAHISSGCASQPFTSASIVLETT